MAIYLFMWSLKPLQNLKGSASPRGMSIQQIMRREVRFQSQFGVFGLGVVLLMDKILHYPL